VDIEDDLVEVMVEVAEGKIDREELADYLAVVCMCS
jgi:death-on-curing protein